MYNIAHLDILFTKGLNAKSGPITIGVVTNIFVSFIPFLSSSTHTYIHLKFPLAVCGAKYKTRPGLTYHYTHTHKEGGGGSDGESRDSRAGAPTPPAQHEYQDSYVTFLNKPAAGELLFF